MRKHRMTWWGVLVISLGVILIAAAGCTVGTGGAPDYIKLGGTLYDRDGRSWECPRVPIEAIEYCDRY